MEAEQQRAKCRCQQDVDKVAGEVAKPRAGIHRGDSVCGGGRRSSRYGVLQPACQPSRLPGSVILLGYAIMTFCCDGGQVPVSKPDVGETARPLSLRRICLKRLDGRFIEVVGGQIPRMRLCGEIHS
jgi:hypothetical protein